MSYELLKPYTSKEYADFVCLHQGLKPYENETAFYFLEANEMVNEQGEIVINPNYEDELAQERQADFQANFIETSLGWFRKIPKGYANAPQSIDIILNMVNAVGSLTEDIANLMIFYTAPDFTDETQCTEEWLVAHSYHPEPMTKEEFMLFYIAFQTAWAQEMYRQSLL